MAAPKDSGWLYAFKEGNEWLIMAGNGLNRTIDRLTRPISQHPAIVLMVGRGTKAASKAFPHLSSLETQAVAHLTIEKSTARKETPLLIAMVDIQNAYSGYHPRTNDVGRKAHQVQWMGKSSDSELCQLVDMAIARLILLFTDVLCIFLDDFQSNKEAFDFLLQWGSVISRYQRPCKPRVLLITRRTLVTTYHQHISGFETVHHFKPTTDQQIFKDLIANNVAIAQRQRKACNMLFSAVHFNAFFAAALQHTARSMEDFNFINATRNSNPLDSVFSNHLQMFLLLSLKNEVNRESSIRHIASAMVMDSCPPKMHRKTLP